MSTVAFRMGVLASVSESSVEREAWRRSGCSKSDTKVVWMSVTDETVWTCKQLSFSPARMRQLQSRQHVLLVLFSPVRKQALWMYPLQHVADTGCTVANWSAYSYPMEWMVDPSAPVTVASSSECNHSNAMAVEVETNPVVAVPDTPTDSHHHSNADATTHIIAVEDDNSNDDSTLAAWYWTNGNNDALLKAVLERPAEAFELAKQRARLLLALVSHQESIAPRPMTLEWLTASERRLVFPHTTNDCDVDRLGHRALAAVVSMTLPHQRGLWQRAEKMLFQLRYKRNGSKYLANLVEQGLLPVWPDEPSRYYLDARDGPTLGFTHDVEDIVFDELDSDELTKPLPVFHFPHTGIDKVMANAAHLYSYRAFNGRVDDSVLKQPHTEWAKEWLSDLESVQQHETKRKRGTIAPLADTVDIEELDRYLPPCLWELWTECRTRPLKYAERSALGMYFGSLGYGVDAVWQRMQQGSSSDGGVKTNERRTNVANMLSWAAKKAVWSCTSLAKKVHSQTSCSLCVMARPGPEKEEALLRYGVPEAMLKAAAEHSTVTGCKIAIAAREDVDIERACDTKVYEPSHFASGFSQLLAQ